MRVDKLKKKVFKTLGVIILIAGVLGAGFGYVYYLNGKLEQDAKDARKDWKRAYSVSESNKLAISDLVESISHYNNTPETIHPTLDGFSTTSSRIRAIKGIIERLKESYKLASLDVTFSNIDKQFDEKTQKYFSILESDVDIIVVAATDELVMSFAKDLSDQTAGYLQLTKLALSRDVVPSNQMITAGTTASEVSAFVEGNLSFSWKTVQGQPIIFTSEQLNTYEKLRNE